MPLARAAAAAAVLGAAAPALAGVVVEATAAGGRTLTMQLEGRRWRVDSTATAKGAEEEHRPSIGIYDAAKGTLVAADPVKRTYHVVDLAAARARAEQMQAQWKAKLAKLPPDQRRQAEERMKGLATPSLGVEVTYEKTGRTGSTAGHGCTFYRAQVAVGVHRETSDVCVVPFAELGVRREDFEALRMQGASPAGRPARDPLAAWASAPGIPFIVEETGADGKRREKMRVTSFRKASIPSSAFEPPAGYEQLETLR